MSQLDDLEARNGMEVSTPQSDVIEQVTTTLERLARGDLSKSYVSSSTHDAQLSVFLNQIMTNLKSVVMHMNLVAQGRYDIEFTPLSDKDELGFAIGDMTAILHEMSLENKKSAWIKSGHAELSNIIRGEQSARELGMNVVSFLARYINALVGTFFQVSTNAPDTLELVGRFALHDDEVRTTIDFGEGLVGQCALEREQLIFNDLPENYLSIASSLGQITPKHLIVTPFLIEQEIVGVMELGLLDAPDHTKLELLRQVSENVAIALKSAKNSEKLNAVLARQEKLS